MRRIQEEELVFIALSPVVAMVATLYIAQTAARRIISNVRRRRVAGTCYDFTRRVNGRVPAGYFEAVDITEL
jgi:hypothetical protein